MKHFIFLLYFCLASLLAFAQKDDFPQKPNRLVSDFANMMSANEVAALEQKLRNYEDTTSTQIAVVTLTSVGDYDVDDYAARLGQKWGIGGKANNNGLLILVAKEQRRVAISTGYGMEHLVPDALAKRITEGTLKPNFQKNQYYKGIDEATSLIISLASGEYQAPPQQERGEGEGGPPIFLIILIVMLVVFIISRRGGGGGRGGRRGARTLGGPIFIPGGFGTFQTGGGIFGGGGGGFGGGGGGFGGFGGGGFGGGGASSSW